MNFETKFKIMVVLAYVFTLMVILGLMHMASMLLFNTSLLPW